MRVPDMAKNPDVLLVYPPVMLEFQPTDPPFGCMYLAAVLRSAGISVEILDLNALRWDEASVHAFFRMHKPPIVAFSGMTTVYYYIKRLAKFIRDQAPEVKLIGGGSFATPCPEEVLKYTVLDVVGIGEGEDTIVPLVRALLTGTPLSNVAGIAYRTEDGTAKRTGTRHRITELDSLPFPAYDLVDMDLYTKNTGKRPALVRLAKKMGIPIETISNYFIMFTERGCPFTCTFCYRNYGRQTSRHSVDYVMEHIKFVKNKFGVNNIAFYDETFNTNKKWVLEFCEKAQEDLPDCFFWVGGARADRLDETTAQAFQAAQFYEISIGVESFDDRVLKEMQKGFDVQTLVDAIELLKRYDMAPSVLAMLYGFPGDDEESLAVTEAGLRRLGIPAYFQFPLPFPGTGLFDQLVREGKIGDMDVFMDSLGDHMTQKLFMNLSKFSDHELIGMVREVERRHADHVLSLSTDFASGWRWGHLAERAGLSRLFSRLKGGFGQSGIGRAS
ncbi:radical SAM protein [Azospirillum sp. CT11-132]|uniref:B12-binding domain-containing radical SAM protein n=1 Tax=Azospirillum sp. CT11-132 TaxID=3396317 RepID=UPI0039A5D320